MSLKLICQTSSVNHQCRLEQHRSDLPPFKCSIIAIFSFSSVQLLVQFIDFFGEHSNLSPQFGLKESDVLHHTPRSYIKKKYLGLIVGDQNPSSSSFQGAPCPSGRAPLSLDVGQSAVRQFVEVLLHDLRDG